MKIATSLIITALVTFQGCARTEDHEQQIIFAQKSYGETPGTAEIIYVAGTLTGEGIGYPNNSTAITCYKDRMACVIYSVDQIGRNQVGRLDIPLDLPVIKWDAVEVVMASSDLLNCRKETISIVRKSETVVWVQEPINQSQAACKNSDTRLYKWSIEDSPAFKAIMAGKQ